MDDNSKLHSVLKDLSEDENAITYILAMLKNERVQNNEIIQELNSEYEIAVATVVNPKLLSKESIKEKRELLYSRFVGKIGKKLNIQ
ncbi:MAG: hypothetical protein JWQ09_5045 [Segetibacter sp.]|nr:hypothetical protein [Segetibacter sp.]